MAETLVPPPPAGQLLDENVVSCSERPLSDPLELADAVARAVCRDPKVLRAWAEVNSQEAQVGVERAAFFPTLSGSVQFNRERSMTDVPSNAALGSDNASRYRQDALALTWLLFDFGARSAKLEGARQLLAAAQGTHAALLQDALLGTARDYHGLLAARAAQGAAREMELVAQNTLDAAKARVEGGVAPVSDFLQARTAHARAVFEKARMEGEVRTLSGVLALDMGLPVQTALRPADLKRLDVAETSQRVEQLLDEADAVHPGIAAARARVASASARRDAAAAAGLPSASLSLRATDSDQPVIPSMGQTPLEARTQGRYLGLQINLPLFEGYASHYRVRAAEADMAAQKESLVETERQVARAVWSGHQALLAGAEALRHTEVLLDSARQQLTAAQERYRYGVANILEPMSAQTALADALRQRIRAETDWRTARLQLAAALGRLGMNSLR